MRALSAPASLIQTGFILPFGAFNLMPLESQESSPIALSQLDEGESAIFAKSDLPPTDQAYLAALGLGDPRKRLPRGACGRKGLRDAEPLRGLLARGPTRGFGG